MALTHLRKKELETIDALRKVAGESDEVLCLLIFLGSFMQVSPDGFIYFASDAEGSRYLEVIRLAALMASVHSPEE